MDDLFDGIGEFIIGALTDFWFELFAPVWLLLGFLVSLGVVELAYHFMAGGWIG